MNLVERIAAVTASFFCICTGYTVAVHVIPDQWVGPLGWGLTSASVLIAAALLIMASRGGRGRHR